MEFQFQGPKILPLRGGFRVFTEAIGREFKCIYY